ncbi:MAG: RNA pyrophosphohydrolase [bacterium]|nr:RNA pyrophosphohydrolase [bacterium]
MTEKPYRKNVAAILLNAQGRVLVGWKHNAWQLPQGGVEEGETPAQALLRELAEEIGTTKFHILRESTQWYCYEWPAPPPPKRQQYRGQCQRYFLVQFDGTDDDIDLAKHREFARITWLTPAEVLTHAWDVKRPIYRKAFEEFGLLSAAPTQPEDPL